MRGGPIGLALLAMIGVFGVRPWPAVGTGARRHRRPRGRRHYLSRTPKPYPDLNVITAHGAWFATLAASLGVCLALASSIPMLRLETKRNEEAQSPAVGVTPNLTSSS